MAMSELRGALLATALMGLVAAIPIALRITGTPFFQPLFEAMIFYFPLVLLIAYSVYSWRKSKSAQVIQKNP